MVTQQKSNICTTTVVYITAAPKVGRHLFCMRKEKALDKIARKEKGRANRYGYIVVGIVSWAYFFSSPQ